MRLNDKLRRKLYDQIIGGLECGSYATFGVVDSNAYQRAWNKADDDEHAKDCFADVVLFNRYTESDGDQEVHFALTDEALVAGFEIMMEKYDHLAGDIISEEGDAITGDAFLQCVVFGEIIYG